MIIRVKVKPNSKEEFLEKTGEHEFIASIKEPPRDGKANRSVIKLLCKEFEINFRQIKIKNPSSREKLIEIEEI